MASARYSDGDFTTAGQDGAKELVLPLQDKGQYYATLVTRRYKALVEYYNPLRYDSTGYTQLLKYSDDLSQADWTKNATTASAGATTDVEGQTNASKLKEDNTNAAHNATQTMTVASGALSFGVIAKQAERKYLRLRINNATDSDLASAVFDLNAGTVTTGTGTIKKLLNGWYWCRVAGTATVSNSKVFCDLSANGSTFSYTGTTGSGVYLMRATAIASAPSVNWPAVQSTATTRAVTVPAVDPDDPLAFLVSESGPDSGVAQFGVAAWSRQYANVPAPITRYSSIAFTKPSGATLATTSYALLDWTASDLAATTTGTIYSYNSYLYTTTNKIYGTLKTATSQVYTYATAGTFTLTYKTSTTAALNYNDTIATIQTALNGLASVIADGLTFSGGSTNLSSVGGGSVILAISAGSTATRVTMTATGLTLANASAPKVAFTRLSSTTAQTIALARWATLTAHGWTTGDLVTQMGTGTGMNLLTYGTQWSVSDANTIAYARYITSSTVAIADCLFANYLRAYTPGATRIGSRITQNFYLPGFTPGIATGDDIPVPQILLNDASFLAAAVATTTGYIGYDANPKDYWMAPIYQQEVIELNSANF